jgi:hypothetical protein
MPNMVGDKVIMDGWYSYTAIIFRNIAEGATVVKDTYALNEFIFKASDNGQLYIDAATNNKVILRPGDNTTAQAAVQQRMKITQLLFQLNETTGTGAHGNNVFIHSQLLVTDQIRDAITAECPLLLLVLTM